MKKKTKAIPPQEYLDSSLWYRETIQDPYQVISAFFDFAEISFYRKVIKGLMVYACRKGICRYIDPGNLLYEFQLLESAINAAYLLDKQDKESPVKIRNEDLLNKEHYYGRFGRLEQWEFFPRHLSLNEYKEPYLVFRRFFKYQSLPVWKEELKGILEDALSPNPGGPEFKTLEMYIHLNKLVEAVHLIDVRENSKNRKKYV